MKSKHETIVGKHFFYCFVDFGKQLHDVPKIYLVPSTVVANLLRRSYADWLAKPGAKGQARKDNDMRRFLPDYSRQYGDESQFKAGWLEQYRDAWPVLGLERQSEPLGNSN